MQESIEIYSGDNRETILAIHAKPTGHVQLERVQALVIMAHDFPGSQDSHNDFFGDLEFLFTNLGYHTLRFDFRGCGQSQGQESDFLFSTALEDFQAVLQWSKNQGFKNLIFVGEGLGASICLSHVAEAPAPVLCSLLFWPALDLRSLAAERFSDNANQDQRIFSWGYDINHSLVEELQKSDMGTVLSNVKHPLLVQIGSEDKVVSPDHLEFLKQHSKAPRIDITSYQKGNYGLTDNKHRKMIFFHAGQFIERYGPQPEAIGL